MTCCSPGRLPARRRVERLEATTRQGARARPCRSSARAWSWCWPRCWRPPAGILRLDLTRSVRGAVKKVVVLDYGSGNLRSAERALARVGADVRSPRTGRPHSTPTASSSPGSGPSPPAWRLRAVDGPGSSAAGWPGAAGAGHLRGHADPVRARRRARRTTPGMRRVARRRRAAQAPVLPHMGWNTVDAPAGTPALRRPGRERFYFVHSYGVRHFPLGAELTGPLQRPWSPGPSTASRSWPRWRTARCRRPSSTPRSPATPGPGCSTNWIQSLG